MTPDEDICDRLISREIDEAPRTLRPFLSSRSEAASIDQTLAYYAYSYQQTFELLFREAHRQPHRDVLWSPLLLICRHSLELSMKCALEVFDAGRNSKRQKNPHDLMLYWNRLLVAIKAAGFETDDAYTATCTAVVRQVHLHDLRGDRFRYPSRMSGERFPSIDVELDDLFRGHWRVTSYCDAVVEMHNQRMDPDTF